MKTVLLIDDDTSGLSVRRYLMAAMNYHVLSASTGIAGLDLLKAHAVDLVVLDYNLPDIDGGQVLRRIRSAKPSVPVILLSGVLSVPEDVLHDVDAFLAKGDSAQTLLNTVAEHIMGRRSETRIYSSEVDR